MSTRNTDFSKILSKKHENKWVAISEDGKTLIAYSDTLLKLKKKVGNTPVVYMKVLPSNVSFAF